MYTNLLININESKRNFTFYGETTTTQAKVVKTESVNPMVSYRHVCA